MNITWIRPRIINGNANPGNELISLGFAADCDQEQRDMLIRIYPKFCLGFPQVAIQDQL
jgi:hypothetical protein